MRRKSSVLPSASGGAVVPKDGGAMTPARVRQRVRQQVESFVGRIQAVSMQEIDGLEADVGSQSAIAAIVRSYAGRKGRGDADTG